MIKKLQIFAIAIILIIGLGVTPPVAQGRQPESESSKSSSGKTSRPASPGGNKRPGYAGIPSTSNGSSNNNRPGNNNKPGNGNNGSNNSNRPGNNNKPGNGNNGNYRPGNNNNKPGNGNNNPNYGNNYRPPVNPDYRPPVNPGYRPPVNPGYRPPVNPGYRPYYPPVPPPYRPYRPPYRPIPCPIYPPNYRPYYYAPTLSGIIGLTFGITLNASLNYLLNNGYSVDGYSDNTVYLRDIRNLGYNWEDGILNYNNNGGLYSAQFISSASHNDTGRYNNVYKSLCQQYGSPINNSFNNGLGNTWFDNGGKSYITLQYNTQYSNGKTRYYTVLTYNY